MGNLWKFLSAGGKKVWLLFEQNHSHCHIEKLDWKRTRAESGDQLVSYYSDINKSW